MINSWERDVLRQTCNYALNSPDPSTQNGAVLTSFTGKVFPRTFAYNEFPRGVIYTDDRWERPLKYAIIEHAERNAIYNAGRIGLCTVGLTLVCPWAACSDCARGIIQSGITRLVTLRPAEQDTHERWQASIDIAFQMLNEAQVEVTFIDGPLGGCEPLRRNGIEFQP